MKRGKEIGCALAMVALLAATGCGSEAPAQNNVTENAEAVMQAQENEVAAAQTTETLESQETPAQETGTATEADNGSGEEQPAAPADPENTDETNAAEDGETAEADETNDGNAASQGAVTADALYTQISSGVSLPQMFLADSGYAENFLGLDMSKVDSLVFAMAEDVSRVDSVILVEAKDEAAADVIAALLENFRAQKVAETDPAGGGYQPELHDDIVASSVGKSGKHVWLVVSPDRAAIEGIVAASWR